MGRRTYSTNICHYCGERVSESGQAKIAHRRRHVREGILTEHRTRAGDVYFLRAQENGNEKPLPELEQCPQCRARVLTEDICCYCGGCMNDKDRVIGTLDHDPCCQCPEWLVPGGTAKEIEREFYRQVAEERERMWICELDGIPPPYSLPARLTTKWLRGLTLSDFITVTALVDEEDNNFQSMAHARVTSDRVARVYEEAKRRGIVKEAHNG